MIFFPRIVRKQKENRKKKQETKNICVCQQTYRSINHHNSDLPPPPKIGGENRGQKKESHPIDPVAHGSSISMIPVLFFVFWLVDFFLAQKHTKHIHTHTHKTHTHTKKKTEKTKDAPTHYKGTFSFALSLSVANNNNNHKSNNKEQQATVFWVLFVCVCVISFHYGRQQQQQPKEKEGQQQQRRIRIGTTTTTTTTTTTCLLEHTGTTHIYFVWSLSIVVVVWGVLEPYVEILESVPFFLKKNFPLSSSLISLSLDSIYILFLLFFVLFWHFILFYLYILSILSLVCLLFFVNQKNQQIYTLYIHTHIHVIYFNIYIYIYQKTQPMPHGRDEGGGTTRTGRGGESSLPEGPIVIPNSNNNHNHENDENDGTTTTITTTTTSSSTIRDVPYNMPCGYEWGEVNVQDKTQLLELYQLLTNNYVEDEDALFRFDYSTDFLVWALTPPGYQTNFLVGVYNKHKLVAFISGIPATIQIYQQMVSVVEINFLCIHKKLRSKRLAPVLIKEMTRRANIQGIYQAVYTAGTILPVPVSTTRYYHRSINPKKLVSIGFSRIPSHGRMTMARMCKIYDLPNTVQSLPQLRPMEIQDVPQVWELVTQYLSKFQLKVLYTKEEIAHWFLPRPGVMDSYVAETWIDVDDDDLNDNDKNNEDDDDEEEEDDHHDDDDHDDNDDKDGNKDNGGGGGGENHNNNNKSGESRQQQEKSEEPNHHQQEEQQQQEENQDSSEQQSLSTTTQSKSKQKRKQRKKKKNKKKQQQHQQQQPPKKTKKITDFISFYHLPSSILNNNNNDNDNPTSPDDDDKNKDDKNKDDNNNTTTTTTTTTATRKKKKEQDYTTLYAAYSYYNIATTVSLEQLLQDALILSKQTGTDVYNALDLMDNQPKEILEPLKFAMGDGQLQYYIYNWSCPILKSYQVGLVLL